MGLVTANALHPHRIRACAAILRGAMHVTDGLTYPKKAIENQTWVRMGIPKPPAAATYNAQIDGSLTAWAGNVVAFRYQDSVHNIQSDLSPLSAVMTSAADPNDGLRVNIPADAAIHPNVDKVIVYRYLYNGSVLFKDGTKAYTGSAITYDLTQADSLLTVQAGDDLDGVPPPCSILIPYTNRMFAMGSPVYGVGVADVTNGSAVVTGYSRAYWTEAMAAAVNQRRFQNIGDTRDYLISSVVESKEIHDCDTAWTASTNVTASLDVDEKKQGDSSVKLVLATGFTTGIIAYKDITSIDLTAYVKVGFWIRSTIALASGDLQLVLDNTAACVSPLEAINIPAIAANAWTYVNLAIATPAGLTAVISVGLKAIVDVGACTIYVDEIRTNSKITLSENYAGTTATGVEYAIIGDRSIVWYSATESDGTPKPESFPSSYWLALNKDDGAVIMGAGVLHGHLVIIKNADIKPNNYIYLTYGVNQGDYESNIRSISTPYNCVAQATVQTIVIDGAEYLVWLSDRGPVIFDGTRVLNLADELEDTFLNMNRSRFKFAHATWNLDLQEYRLYVPSSGSNMLDTRFIFTPKFKSPVNIYGSWWKDTGGDWESAVYYKESNGAWNELTGDTIGFIRRSDTGMNDGAGNSTTRTGLVTSAASTTLTDSLATFPTDGDGLKSVYVEIISGTGSGQRRRIKSNTATVLTLYTAWNTTPDTTSIYAIGNIDQKWLTRWEDDGDGGRKKKYGYLKMVMTPQAAGSMNVDMFVHNGSGFSTTRVGNVTLDLTKSYILKKLMGRGYHRQLSFEVKNVDQQFEMKEFHVSFAQKGEK